jgi:glucokinase-like ROK family protein
VEQLVKAIHAPVISEGRISTPAEARTMFDLGVYAVVVGSMITRPRWIVQHYVNALQPPASKDVSVPVLAVDIGGTKISAAICSQAPSLDQFREIPTEAAAGGAAVLERVTQLVEQSLHDAKGHVEIKAIGVSTAGTPDSLGRIVYATGNLPGWIGTDLRGHLEAHFGLPVIADNDGQMATVAEIRCGAGRGFRSALCLTLGTGLGAGFAVNGQPYRGERGAGPTLGHIPVERNGRPCTCGRRGCLEQYVNGAALVAEYNALVPEAQRVKIGTDVMQAASGGDTKALHAIEIVGDWLGYGLASAVSLLDPSIIVVGGGLSALGDWLLAPARRTLAAHIYPAISERPIVTAQLGSNAGLIGAALYAQDMVLEKT